MSLLLTCPSQMAVLLVGVESEEGPMRFPAGDQIIPGFTVHVDPSVSLNEQFIAVTTQGLGKAIDGHKLQIEQEFSAPLTLVDQTEATLYVATIGWHFLLANLTWPTMPELLRRMPKDRNRLAYVKAWQVLTGALKEGTKAVDLEDIIKHFDPQ